MSQVIELSEILVRLMLPMRNAGRAQNRGTTSVDHKAKPTPAEIRKAREENPKLRERDLSLNLGVSELEFLAAHIGERADGKVTRLEPNVSELLKGLEAVGEVMALTRNESAVHEKIGVYDKMSGGGHAIMFLGDNIDLRIFPGVWKHAYAVEKTDENGVRHSLQFFDASGDAVHKVHLRPASNLDAFLKLVAAHVSADQSETVEIKPVEKKGEEVSPTTVEELRDRWSKLTDTHQFFGMLQQLKLTRARAMHMVGQDYAWQLEPGAVTDMLHGAAEAGFPMMAFVGNRGCIQIHSGPISNIKPMGPWINILDETFHMHLRTDHIVEAWGVRKPTSDGHVTSVEAYDKDGNLIIQFFGKRLEGTDERAEWRALVEALPVAKQNAA